MGYLAIASPLTDLLKKNKAWIWDEECQAAFKNLKKAVMEELVLRLPDVTMPFELHMDASDFAIGGVLMQDRHPIVIENRKLNEMEMKCTVQENEMTAVVHCLRIWRHYLLGSRFVIKTDNIATSYFQTQKKLSPKQAHWQDFLAEFDYQLEYKQGKANVVADAFSHKAEFVAITQAQFFLQDRIKEGLEHDPLAKKIIALAKDGRTRRFWLKGDMLFTKGDRFYVPKWGDLRRAILKEWHDSKWAGHPGITRTLALVEAAPPDATTDNTSKLFFKNVVKYWGLPHVIVSDRDPRFTWRFWTKLFKIMGTDLNFSMSFHPQTDGQTKRVNALLELYLWHYVSANQHDWAKLLDVAQFSYNMQRSKATRKSPFELVTGRQPLTPNALAASYEGSSLAAYKTINEWHEQADLAWASLDKAAKKMKKWADEKRRHIEFEVTDQVMVKLLPQQFKSLRKVHKGLIRRYEGPFPMIGRVGKVSYRVQLPPKLKIHPAFHVSFLKPYHGDEEDPERGVSKRLGHQQRLLFWRDFPDSEASWEAEDLLWQFADEIKRYHEDGTTRTRLSGILWKVGEGLGSPWKLMEDLEASCRRL
ncbi:reverse transcriptase [Tanacetum coccineum]